MLRQRPFSEMYGLDRGTAIDRYFLRSYFNDHRLDIQGSVLEVRDPEFSRGFGSRIARLDILDLDPTNDRATVIADLSCPGSLPPAQFDCVICTQTLQYVVDPGEAIRNCYTTLRLGGVLLLSVPTVARIDPNAERSTDLWRITPDGLDALIRRCVPEARIEVTTYGNLPAAVGFLLGAAVEDLPGGLLDNPDPDFPILACARIEKIQL